MKYLALFCLLFLFLNSVVYAQEKVFIGIQAGINRATATQANQGITQFSGGLSAVLPVGKKLNFQTGLFYQGKGWATNETYYRNKIRTNHLQIPLYLNYCVKMKPGKLYVGTGPYVAAALSGRYEYEAPVVYDYAYSVTGPTNSPYPWSQYSSKIIIGNEVLPQDATDYRIRRMDYGLTGHAGFILNNGFFINAGYDIGLANTSYSRIARRLQTANVSVGYFFK